MNFSVPKNYSLWLFILSALAISLYFKLSLIGIGAPYTTIDDNTLFNAGFLVWFGEAPPQRMYLESWMVGATSIVTFIYSELLSGDAFQLNLNLVANAYRDFQNDPKQYVINYRYLMLFADLLTAYFVYRLSKLFISSDKHNWLAALPACMYLLSYNTLWCNLVARPDTMTAFFSVVGVYCYFLSQQGLKATQLYLSAIFLGCATGFKLHAAFFVVAIVIDLLRIHGLRRCASVILPFGGIAVFLFCVTAGSPLFDPLLYIKLRALNARDDASPWIQQGEQLLVVMKSTGWLTIPLLLSAAVLILKQWKTNLNQKHKSLLLVAGLFLLLFCSLRVLRGYWMLPALPLFYILSTYTLSQIKNRIVTLSVVIVIFTIFSFQIFQQHQHFNKASYNELQTWIKANVKDEDTLYILGFDTIFLPYTTTNLQNRKFALTNSLEKAVKEGEDFTSRHVRLWEERAALMLIDMLNGQSPQGYNYYSLNGTPLESLEGVLSYDDVDYMLVMKGVNNADTNGLLARTHVDFIKVTEANAPGGSSGTGGLTYEIYKRKSHAN